MILNGGLAQLARALDWQSKGQGFDSPNLHEKPLFDIQMAAFQV
jgi:hypothetical protein